MQINTNVNSIKQNINQNLQQKTENKQNDTVVNRTEVKELPSADVLKAYVGLSVHKTDEVKNENITKEQKPQEMSAYDYLLTLPNVKQAFKNELAQVAAVMEKADVEAENTSKLVNLVADGTLWRGVLRYFCEHGQMTEPMKNDIDLIYNAKNDGINQTDRYVPTFTNKEDAVKSVKVGDTFEVDGQKNIYVKNADGQAHQLKMGKQTFAELFPPATRFSGVQGAAGDCYLLATLNSIMENPSQRHVLYDMFEETENGVNVKMPNGEYTYTVPKDNMRQGIDTWQHMQGATGMILAEHVYGEELKHQYEKSFHEIMNSEISRMAKEEPENKEKIEGYKQRLADFDAKNQDGETFPVLMRFENPDANGKLTFKYDENGIMFKDLKTANKEIRRKLSTQADFYRGSIGGDLDTVMKDFGYTDITEYKTNNAEQEKNLKELLFSPETQDEYIFTAGALSDGTLTEKPIAKEYSVYGCHAYKIAPFQDKDGNTKFVVENPWNATQNSIMEYDKLKEFFEVICAVKTK
ncbi:MAG: hypothetical protein K6C94_04005 [Candidatus Gastranaerophilales bacterium]|nr:hypothetical protein [Candidatus Gastranaerophilales bacterium]